MHQLHRNACFVYMLVVTFYCGRKTGAARWTRASNWNAALQIRHYDREEPKFASVQPEKSIKSGGIEVVVIGSAFDLIKQAQMVIKDGDVELIGEKCRIANAQLMTCLTPNLHISPNRHQEPTVKHPLMFDYGFKLKTDDIHAGCSAEVCSEYVFLRDQSERHRCCESQWLGFGRISVFPDPIIGRFLNDSIKHYRVGDSLTINGRHINAAASQRDVLVAIGMQTCSLIVFAERALICEPPWDRPQPRIHGHVHPEVIVTIGRKTYDVGYLSYEEPGNIKTSAQGSVLLVGLIASVTVVAIFAIFICYLKMKHQKNEQKRRLLELYQQFTFTTATVKLSDNRSTDHCYENTLTLLNTQVIEEIPYNRDKYELEKNNVKMLELLGEGEFGRVYRGDYDRKIVAIKTPRNGYNVEHQCALLIELKIMIAIGEHKNILKMIGAITSEIKHGKLYVITEYCSMGNLRDFLSSHRTNFNCLISRSRHDSTIYKMPNTGEWSGKSNGYSQPSSLSTADLLSYAFQVANGMMFLGCRKLIHRDLAARNVFLSEDGVVKRSKNTPLPIHWMALESLLDMKFSVQSDVWSFGVVLWEIFSLGNVPYADIIPADYSSLVNYLRNGHRLTPPDFVPPEIYQLMRRCWLQKQNRRPSFEECAVEIADHANRCSKELFAKLCNKLNGCLMAPTCVSGDQQLLDGHRDENSELSTATVSINHPACSKLPTSENKILASPKGKKSFIRKSDRARNCGEVISLSEIRMTPI